MNIYVDALNELLLGIDSSKQTIDRIQNKASWFT